MSYSGLLRQIVGVTLALLLLVGRGASAASPPPGPLPTPVEQPALFHYLRTVQVTPDATFQTGSFARINYVPATDRFVVTFGTKSPNVYVSLVSPHREKQIR